MPILASSPRIFFMFILLADVLDSVEDGLSDQCGPKKAKPCDDHSCCNSDYKRKHPSSLLHLDEQVNLSGKLRHAVVHLADRIPEVVDLGVELLELVVSFLEPLHRKRLE